jgi:Lrp/AsnC family transcriptional regulator for asnA, asnC and gidA
MGTVRASRAQTRSAEPAEPAPAVPLLDDAGRAIIGQLQQDGRRSYTAIAAGVGLSEAAVRQRVRALLDSGVVQIVAVTDPLTLGLGVMALVGVRVDGDTRTVAEAVSVPVEVDYVVLTAGHYDLMLELTCRDNEHLLDVVNAIRSVPGVRDTDTFISLRVHKQTYTWGAP